MKPAARVICAGYESALGTRFRCLTSTVIREGERGGELVLGTCPRCMALREQAIRDKAMRADRGAERDRRRGKKYGPAGPGCDVFAGFRGGIE